MTVFGPIGHAEKRRLLRSRIHRLARDLRAGKSAPRIARPTAALIFGHRKAFVMLLRMSGGNRVTGSERQGDPWHVTPPDTTQPNAARIYDFLLGGKDSFTVDREAAARLLELIPDVAVACQDNRRFLGRAVRYLTAERGIRQFIDIGTGLPTQGNVHEIAQGIAPEARVVYVDYDPIVITTRTRSWPSSRA